MIDNSMYKEAKRRNRTHKETILSVLRNAGDEGVLNTELVKYCLRYGGVLGELYQMGYKIDCEHLGQGICKYTLIEEPANPIKKVPSAIDLLKDAIDKTMDGAVTSESLEALLNKLNFHVVRKAGSHKALNN